MAFYEDPAPLPGRLNGPHRVMPQPSDHGIRSTTQPNFPSSDSESDDQRPPLIESSSDEEVCFTRDDFVDSDSDPEFTAYALRSRNRTESTCASESGQPKNKNKNKNDNENTSNVFTAAPARIISELSGCDPPIATGLRTVCALAATPASSMARERKVKFQALSGDGISVGDDQCIDLNVETIPFNVYDPHRIHSTGGSTTVRPHLSHCPPRHGRRHGAILELGNGELFQTPAAHTVARFKIDKANAASVQTALSLRVCLDQYSGKDCRGISSAPLRWNATKSLQAIRKALFGREHARRPASSSMKWSSADQLDVHWPKVKFRNFIYVFQPSPVCTDQQVQNCGPRGQPVVRNTAPEKFENPDWKGVQDLVEDNPHLVASALRCAGSAAYARAVDIGIQKWIADTGAGLHLIPRAAVRKRNLFSKCRKLQNPLYYAYC